MKETRRGNARTIDHHSDDSAPGFGETAISGLRWGGQGIVDPKQAEIARKTSDHFDIERGTRPIIHYDDFVVVRIDMPLVRGRQGIERPWRFATHIVDHHDHRHMRFTSDFRIQLDSFLVFNFPGATNKYPNRKRGNEQLHLNFPIPQSLATRQ
jgi:hypothetical protein